MSLCCSVSVISEAPIQIKPTIRQDRVDQLSGWMRYYISRYQNLDWSQAMFVHSDGNGTWVTQAAFLGMM